MSKKNEEIRAVEQTTFGEHKKMKKKYSQLLPLFACLAMLFTGCGQNADDDHEALLRLTAEQRDLQLTVTAKGNLQSADSVKIRPGIDGKLSWLIEDGSEVEAGAKLAEFETEQIEEQIENTQQDIEDKLRDLASKRSDLEVYRLEVQQRVQKAEQDVTFAEQEREQEVASTLILDEQDLVLVLEQAETNQKDLAARLERMPELLEKGFVTSAEVRQMELDLKSAKQRSQRAKQELQAFRTYSKPRRLAKLDSSIAEKKLSLTKEKRAGERNIADKTAAIELLERRIANQRDKLQKMQEDLQKHVVTAPSPGMVLHGSVDQWGRSQEVEVGQNIDARRIICRLPDLTNMIVNCEILESDIGKLAVDQPAEIVLPSLDDARYQGRMLSIDPTAVPQHRWDTRPKRYKVEVSLDGTEGASFRPDISAEVDIVTGNRQQVLALPIDAIESEGDRHWCLMADGSERDLELGVSTTTHVEITAGLQPGETVLVRQQGQSRSNEQTADGE